MQTKTERLIRHKRKRGGILVPMIEDFMLKPVNIEDEYDVEFLTLLNIKMMLREQSRNEKPVFSPSALGSCLREVYLVRHHKQLGIKKRRQPRVEPNFYFLNGNFLHLKWQFVLFKMMKAGVKGIEPLEIDDMEPRWCEVPIMGKRGDHGGTLDVGLKIFEVPMFIDFKGINVRSFGEITRGEIPLGYGLQLADYMMLYNSHPNRKQAGMPRIEQSLLISENKGGPDNSHHAALHENVIDLEDFKPEVKRRLKELRTHEADEEIPKPECTSTRGFQFQGCPFAGFCKSEIKAIEAARKAKDDVNSYRVAIPNRKRKRK